MARRLSLCAGVGKGAAVAKGLSCYLFVAAAVTECELVNAAGNHVRVSHAFDERTFILFW